MRFRGRIGDQAVDHGQAPAGEINAPSLGVVGGEAVDGDVHQTALLVMLKMSVSLPSITGA